MMGYEKASYYVRPIASNVRELQWIPEHNDFFIRRVREIRDVRIGRILYYTTHSHVFLHQFDGKHTHILKLSLKQSAMRYIDMLAEHIKNNGTFEEFCQIQAL